MTGGGSDAIPGLVRDPHPDPEAVGEDAELVERLRAEIAAEGPITFARFMERALYEPGHGYYRRPDRGSGVRGRLRHGPGAAPDLRHRDRAVARAGLGRRWTVRTRSSSPRPAPERAPSPPACSAGCGTRARRSSPRSATARWNARKRASPRSGTASRPTAWRVTSSTTRRRGDAIETGAVVANEVLDALPVHRVVGRPDGLRERFVGVDGDRFAWVEAEPSTPELAARLEAEGVELADGQVTEVCLAVDGWLAATTAHLARGPVVLVDYADEPAALHSIARPDGTLRAFARHAVGGDALRHVGRQDLTATVDLAAVRAAAARAGLDPVGETTQAELLAASGDLASAWLSRPGATIEDALLLRSALQRLLDPRGMGGFRVLVFGRGMPPDAALPALRRIDR